MILILIAAAAQTPLPKHDFKAVQAAESTALENDLQNRLKPCGIQNAQITVKYEDYLQAAEATLDGQTFTDAQLLCIAEKTSIDGAFLNFADPKTRERYGPILSQAIDAAGYRSATEWLRIQGKLDNLPRFDPATTTLTAFSNGLEQFCEVKIGSFYKVVDNKVLSMKIHPIGKIPRLSDEQFHCLINVVTASNLRDYGITFGLIGNEAIAEPATQK